LFLEKKMGNILKEKEASNEKEKKRRKEDYIMKVI
jgi:hypothetical protein